MGPCQIFAQARKRRERRVRIRARARRRILRLAQSLAPLRLLLLCRTLRRSELRLNLRLFVHILGAEARKGNSMRLCVSISGRLGLTPHHRELGTALLVGPSQG